MNPILRISCRVKYRKGLIEMVCIKIRETVLGQIVRGTGHFDRLLG